MVDVQFFSPVSSMVDVQFFSPVWWLMSSSFLCVFQACQNSQTEAAALQAIRNAKGNNFCVDCEAPSEYETGSTDPLYSLIHPKYTFNVLAVVEIVHLLQL